MIKPGVFNGHENNPFGLWLDEPGRRALREIHWIPPTILVDQTASTATTPHYAARQSVKFISENEWHQRQAILQILREHTGLHERSDLHPAPGALYRQDNAIDVLLRLVANNSFRRSQLGLFAQETCQSGKRKYYVDTFAGFCIDHSPNCWTKQKKDVCHYYEVILHDRPCWLYFDLEYSRETNPELHPNVAMAAFERTLMAFCAERLHTPVDATGILILESSTTDKFSKHVLVKRFFSTHTDENKAVHQAFANNAQAGMFVKELIAFAREHRENSCSKYLFVDHPKTRAGEVRRETTLIDDSVYSRNRCFRLLFNSKFGKERQLELEHSSANRFFIEMPHPSLALLSSMVSFVPDNTMLFDHSLLHSSRSPADITAALRPQCDSIIAYGNKVQFDTHDPLLKHLIHSWDEARSKHDKFFEKAPPTGIDRIVDIGERLRTVTLSNNRFCFHKGSSHKSNHIYLVVDKTNRTFIQKCYDPDCRSFGSMKFHIPVSVFVSLEKGHTYPRSIDNATIRTHETYQSEARQLTSNKRQRNAGTE
jgi:hypothetical protein